MDCTSDKRIASPRSAIHDDETIHELVRNISDVATLEYSLGKRTVELTAPPVKCRWKLGTWDRLDNLFMRFVCAKRLRTLVKQ